MAYKWHSLKKCRANFVEQKACCNLCQTCLFRKTLKQVLQENLVDLNTNGETADTSSKSGLWKKLKDQLGRGLLTVWRAAHRCGVALEDFETAAVFGI